MPDTPEVHTTLGLWSASRGQLDAAIAEFSRALEGNPDLAETQWHLGAALAQRGAFADAVEHLRRAVELDPSNMDAQHDLDSVRAFMAARPSGKP